MSNDTPNDPFGIEAAFKQIADAWNEGLEQAKRIQECKMRRFYWLSPDKTTIRHSGVVFPDGEVVVHKCSTTKAIHAFRSLDEYTDSYRYSCIQWIDPEPQGWHFYPEVQR